jgi:predicted nucleic acid-binding protein
VAFSALLDTCVLVPSRGRDVLLEVAVGGVYRPLWSSGVLDELARTLRTLGERRGAAPDETDAYVGRLVRQMALSFPDALVEGWEGVEGSIKLPDPDDRHVVAAALIGRADVIVTDNTKDFPAEQLPSSLFIQTLDEFLLDSLDLHPAAVISAVVRVADRTGRNGPRLTPADVADFLAATSAPAFGAAVKLALS